jgi:selenocysteine lyase/cysteine desulfurase
VCQSFDVGAGSIDVEAVRAATPGCGEQVFLLSAGSSLPTAETLERVVGYLRREAEVGGYAAAEEIVGELVQARHDLAALVGGAPHEMALAASDTAAWTKAWWGWVAGGNVPAGSTVLVDRLIYHSHYAALVATAPMAGFEIQLMPSLADGTLDIDALEVSQEVSAICATMIGTHCGNVNPISELGAKAEAAGIPMFLDACQAIGQMELDVASLGCHVLTATGRKFLRAPRGTGMLWVAAGIVDRFRPPGIDATSSGWTAEAGLDVHPGIARFEEYEVAYAAMVGLASAVSQARTLGMASIEARVRQLADDLRDGLAALPAVSVTDLAERRSAIVTFQVEGVSPADVVAAASRDRIVINESTAVWAALDMDAKGLSHVVRASPHYFNTHDELDQLIRCVARLTR